MNKINFENYPSLNTPLSAQNLNLMQDNIDNAKIEKSIQFSGDLNDINDTCFYYCTGGLNRPAGNGYLLTQKYTDNYLYQRYIVYDKSATYERTKVNGVWNDWGGGKSGSSKNTNGYTYLSNGMLMQWGEASCDGNGFATVNFPIEFPNNCLNLTANPKYTSGANCLTTICTTQIGSKSSGVVYMRYFDGSSFQLVTNTTHKIYWTAIGY